MPRLVLQIAAVDLLYFQIDQPFAFFALLWTLKIELQQDVQAVEKEPQKELVYSGSLVYLKSWFSCYCGFDS